VENFKPVFWHQGLFLQPQHFQQADQYQAGLLRPYRTLLQPHFWGVARLELASAALEHGACEIEAGEFVFPDGTYVNLPDNGVVAARTFDADAVGADKPLRIYLGLRKFNPYADNVTQVQNLDAASNVATRYAALTDVEPVRDVYQESPDAQVKTLHHVLRIVLESEREEMHDYWLIPIAQLRRDGDAVHYDKEFLPPLLTIGAMPAMQHMLKEIRDDMTGRAMQLEGYKAPLHGHKEFDPGLMRYKLALRTLSFHIARLFHIIESGVVHPWDVYGALRELVAELSTFTESVNVLGEGSDGARLVPAYDHQALGNCFGQLRSVLNRLLNEITIGPRYLVLMEREAALFHAAVPAEFFDDSNAFYLVFNTSQPFEEHLPGLLTTAKLAARSDVADLVDRSLPGLGMVHMQIAPPGLPRRANAHYVRIDTQDRMWSTVQQAREIALHWAEAPEDLKIEFVVVRR